jgi:hypothetical protein
MDHTCLRQDFHHWTIRDLDTGDLPTALPGHAHVGASLHHHAKDGMDTNVSRCWHQIGDTYRCA